MATKLLSDLAKGTWSSLTAYTVGDIVDLASSSYICIANNTNHTPPNGTYWAILAKGIVPMGAYDNSTDYNVGEYVSYLGSSYIMYVNATPGTLPTDTTKWQIVASKGDAGSTGAKGDKGDQGDPGNDGADGADGADGTDGEDGVNAGLSYNFDSSTTDADPGNGDIRLNNATLASVTQLFIDNLESNGGNVSAQIDTWDDSTNTALRGTIIIRKLSAKANFAIYDVTGAVTDGTGYRKVVVTHVASNGSFSNADALSVEFVRTGNKGTDGAGDVLGPATNTDANIPQWNGTDSKTLKNGLGLDTDISSVSASDDTVPSAKAVRTAIDLMVAKSLYDANTILIATSDNTPIALTIGASTIVGRKSSGDIVALSASEVRTIINVADGATANTKATGAEVDTGTDDAKFVTAKAIEDSAYIKAAYADALVLDSIADSDTTHAPSRNAVFDALALKAPLASPTFTGVVTAPNITLPTNGQILLTVPTTDGHATGLTTNAFNSGYSSSAVGDLVYLDSSSTWQKCDANTLLLYNGLLGIALEVKASGAALLVALPGSFVYATGFPTFTIGLPIYMSETAGAVTQTAPTTTDAATRVIGWGIHADKMYFNPSPDYLTHI